MIYLDNAATTFPKPPEVVRAVTQAMMEYSANPGRSGHALAMRAAQSVYAARVAAAEMFGADNPDRVVFTLNCTHAVNFVLKGLLSPGDHVITSCLEHNAVVRPLHKLAQSGVSVSRFSVDLHDPELCTRQIERLIRPATRMIFCTHCSNVFGTVLPIKQIGSIAKKHSLLFGVDAAQSAGLIDIDIEQMNIDYLCMPGHKALYGPMGTGLLIMRAAPPDSIIEGGTGSLSNTPVQPEELPERLESGTLNLPGIAGLRAGIDFVRQREMREIYEHELELTKRLYAQLSGIPDVRLYTPPPEPCRCAPVLSFNKEGVGSEIVAGYLSKGGFAVRAGLHCAFLAHETASSLPGGTVRVCPGVFNTAGDIDDFVQYVKKF